MRCFTSAAWLTSGIFKSLCAETVPQSPKMTRQRANGLSVSVFIIQAITLLRFSPLRYQIIANFSFALRVELVPAMRSNYLVIEALLETTDFCRKTWGKITRIGKEAYNYE